MGEVKIEEVDSNGKSPQQIEKDILDNHAKDMSAKNDIVAGNSSDGVLEVKGVNK